MKIALLTIWHEKNFGAELQTYATIKTLSERGHKVEAIDFRLHDSKVTSLKSRFFNVVESFMPANQNFEKFWKSYIPSTRHYIDIDDLNCDPPLADCYLVGSDQVWNPDITKEKAAIYFLSFVPEGLMRISYASSVGANEWSGTLDLTSKVKVQLSKFDFISCREDTGAALLKKQFDVNAAVVLDPTLLRKNFNELIGNYKKRNTLALYQLYESEELTKAAKFIAIKMNLRFCDVNKIRKIFFNKLLYSRTSIIDWIRGIAESEFVVTHSFHGMVLALLYHKQFVIIFNSQNNRSSRITDLLKKLSLEDRYFTRVDDALTSNIWNQKIDFEEVDIKLNTLREKSLFYLTSAGL